MDEEICFLPALELARLIRRRELSPVEVTRAFLERIERRNPELNAYVTILADRALERAAQAGKALQSGAEIGPLHGVPVAIKDLVDALAGVRNTFGSRIFAQFVPDWTATYVERLERAGAIVLGKTNTPEFGHKGVTDNLLFGPTSTPFAPGKNAGGSSGGSAAAVADGLAALAQGSDAGGSIRIPAACCGVYGLKASFGRVAAVSRPDAFLSHTPFLHAGPITRTVRDAALMLEVMAGPEDGDPFSLPESGRDFLSACERFPPDLKIAYSPNLDVFPVSAAVGGVVGEAVGAFEDTGAAVEEVRIGLERSQRELSDLWLGQMAVLYASLADSLLSQGVDLMARRDEIAPEFASLIERGNTVTALEYKRMEVVRTQVYDAVQQLFSRFDLLLCPTLSVLPFDNAADGNTLGPGEVEGEAVDPTIGWCLTYPFNFTGHPAASIPAGLSSDGLPVGLQIVGRRFDDALVLSASAAFEELRSWADLYPGLSAS